MGSCEHHSSSDSTGPFRSQAQGHEVYRPIIHPAFAQLQWKVAGWPGGPSPGAASYENERERARETRA